MAKNVWKVDEGEGYFWGDLVGEAIAEDVDGIIQVGAQVIVPPRWPPAQMVVFPPLRRLILLLLLF